ncbi:hypothetical protein CYLTODRAFT_492349 [Cylindrobasidium torrendii FP15055 ss-10]|uniref:MYND-type domain-containing protein n=1 Tax=Cylindrobasidium torrendii FP15055 ss-10 TaxID=1314674 RepID=A0A0D7B7B2_9AGAR|nr:hypothetical protein CYLTODRAFT_492349 [Cylindrobasidium torrendii FP15055 ss-10]
MSMLHPASIAFFVDSLSPSVLPCCCSLFFFGMYQEIVPKVNELRSIHPEIFSAALKCITSPRTREELVALGSALLVCNCPVSHNCVVADLPKTATAAGVQFFNSLCGIVSAGLWMDREPMQHSSSNWKTLDSLVRASRKAFKQTGRAPWPSQHNDIFLGKPKEVVGMIWRIFDTFPETDGPLILFCTLWTLSPATTSPIVSFIEDGRWPAQLIGHANRVFDEESRMHTQSGSDNFNTLLLLLGQVAAAFRTLDFESLDLWSKHNLDVVRFASRVLRSDAFKDRSDGQATTLINIGSTFWADSLMIPPDGTTGDFSEEERKTISPRINAPQQQRSENLSQRAGTLSEEEFARLRSLTCTRLINAALSEACAAPDCSHTTTTKNRRFAICERCCLASYCSTECQAAAWKHVEVPHKPVCKFMEEINKKLKVNWRKIRYGAHRDALRQRSACLSQQECADIMDWTDSLIMWRACAKYGDSES